MKKSERSEVRRPFVDRNGLEWGVCDMCKEWTARVVWMRTSCCADCWGDIRSERARVRGEGDDRVPCDGHKSRDLATPAPLPNPEPYQQLEFEF